MKAKRKPTHQNFEGKTAVVAGGMGFIGSSLCRRLLDCGAVVRCVDNLNDRCGGNPRNIHDIASAMEVAVADVADDAVMRPIMDGADFLFNMVGKTSHVESISDPAADLAVNCSAQIALLETCRTTNPSVKILFAGTRQVYGAPVSLPVTESHPLAPVDLNGVHKMCAEMYHTLYSSLHSMDVTVLRLTNTYGPRMVIRDARQTFLGVWIRRVLEGEDIIIYGDGEQLRDLSYVDDAVDALLLAALDEHARGQIFNLGGKEVLSLKQIAAILIAQCGGGNVRKEAFPALLKAIDIGDYHADFGLIREQLGWTPRVSAEDGIAATLAYFRDNWEYYVE